MSSAVEATQPAPSLISIHGAGRRAEPGHKEWIDRPAHSLQRRSGDPPRSRRRGCGSSPTATRRAARSAVAAARLQRARQFGREARSRRSNTTNACRVRSRPTAARPTHASDHRRAGPTHGRAIAGPGFAPRPRRFRQQRASIAVEAQPAFGGKLVDDCGGDRLGDRADLEQGLRAQLADDPPDSRDTAVDDRGKSVRRGDAQGHVGQVVVAAVRVGVIADRLSRPGHAGLHRNLFGEGRAGRPTRDRARRRQTHASSCA